MTVQNINIGNQVNDGLGDDLRTAFEKVNANFISLGAELTFSDEDPYPGCSFLTSINPLFILSINSCCSGVGFGGSSTF